MKKLINHSICTIYWSISDVVNSNDKQGGTASCMKNSVNDIMLERSLHISGNLTTSNLFFFSSESMSYHTAGYAFEVQIFAKLVKISVAN